MIDWDDVRYFLAVARGGSVRPPPGASGEPRDRAATHRSARGTPRSAHVRKAAFGLPPDGCGREVLELADQMEASSHQLETRVFGRDQSVRGFCG